MHSITSAIALVVLSTAIVVNAAPISRPSELSPRDVFGYAVKDIAGFLVDGVRATFKTGSVEIKNAASRQAFLKFIGFESETQLASTLEKIQFDGFQSVKQKMLRAAYKARKVDVKARFVFMEIKQNAIMRFSADFANPVGEDIVLFKFLARNGDADAITQLKRLSPELQKKWKVAAVLHPYRKLKIGAAVAVGGGAAVVGGSVGAAAVASEVLNSSPDQDQALSQDVDDTDIPSSAGETEAMLMRRKHELQPLADID